MEEVFFRNPLPEKWEYKIYVL